MKIVKTFKHKSKYEYVDVENKDGGFYYFNIYDIKDIEDDFEEITNL